MRYDEDDRKSSNVEDRRGQGGGGFGLPGGGGIRIPIGGKGGFSFTTLLIIGAVMLFFGINPLDLLRGGGGGVFPDVQQLPRMEQRPTANRSPFDIPGLPGGGAGRQAQPGQPAGPPGAQTTDAMGEFITRVLADTEDVWNRVFKSFGREYREPKLVLFSNATRTACGTGMAAMGPFYCPIDQKIYVDLSFYEQLKRRFKAPGDFAQAYVIAHEVGHHVQTLLGIAEKVQQMKSRMSERESNQLQVRMELQADCLSGVWANLNHQLNNRLEQGDIEEGLNAASAIGDDMIQRRSQGYVVPDAFTHGSSEQRVRWFRRGFEAGKMQVCDTFSAPDL
ncbi:MAG: zinc metallopeptidase [Hyphomicrobiaceae bacterium]|nr:zinc metallopeptidase [Hyphomicrobiaceae bacterium]